MTTDTDRYAEDYLYGEASVLGSDPELDAETWRPRRSAGAALWIIAGCSLALLVAFVVMLRVTGGVS